jgi:hypothetical protein
LRKPLTANSIVFSGLVFERSVSIVFQLSFLLKLRHVFSRDNFCCSANPFWQFHGTDCQITKVIAFCLVLFCNDRGCKQPTSRWIKWRRTFKEMWCNLRTRFSRK